MVGGGGGSEACRPRGERKSDSSHLAAVPTLRSKAPEAEPQLIGCFHMTSDRGQEVKCKPVVEDLSFRKMPII